MPIIPNAIEELNLRFLHHKARAGLSRKARCRKSHHHGVLSKMYNPREMKYPINSILSRAPFMNLRPLPVQSTLHDQIRFFSSRTDQFVTDEADFDTMLHEREFEMHRHERSPIPRIINYGKNAMNKVDGTIKILDVASSPIDASFALTKELRGASLFAISSSRDMIKVISDKLAEDSLPNVMTELSDLSSLTEFEDGSFDLVVSCYGLQVSSCQGIMASFYHF